MLAHLEEIIYTRKVTKQSVSPVGSTSALQFFLTSPCGSSFGSSLSSGPGHCSSPGFLLLSTSFYVVGSDAFL